MTTQPKPIAAQRLRKVFIGDWYAEGASYDEGQDPESRGAYWHPISNTTDNRVPDCSFPKGAIR